MLLTALESILTITHAVVGKRCQLIHKKHVNYSGIFKLNVSIKQLLSLLKPSDMMRWQASQ